MAYKPPKILITETTNFTVTALHQGAIVVLDTSSNDIIASLPSSPEGGDVYVFKKASGANIAQVGTSDNKTVNGEEAFVFAENQEVITVVYSGGTNWDVESHYSPFVETLGEALLQDGIIYGGATWIENLDFDVTEVKFILDGVIYLAGPDSVTLSAADPGDARIDVIVANTDGTISVVEGTPSPDPAKPEIDFSSQVEVSFVTIEAGATEPAGVASSDIYKENTGTPTEWNGTDNTGGARIDFADSNAYQGVFNVAGNSVVDGDTITFTAGGLVTTALISQLTLRIQGNGCWANQDRLDIRWLNAGVPVSDFVTIKDHPVEFNSCDTETYTLFVFDRNEFAFTAAQANQIEIVASTNSNFSFYLDNITWVEGLPSPDVSQFEFTITDGTNPFAVQSEETVEFTSPDASITIDTSVDNQVRIQAAAAALANIYTADGTLGGTRTVTGGGFELTFTNNDDTVMRIEQTGTVGSSESALYIEAPDNAISSPLDVQGGITRTATFSNFNDNAIPVGITLDTPTNTNAVRDLLVLSRTTAGTAANGIGAGIRFDVENDGGSTSETGTIDVVLVDASANREADMNFRVHPSGASVQTILTLNGEGGITAPFYGSGTFTGTLAQLIGVNASGQLIELGTSLDNIYTADGSLTGDRLVTGADFELTFTGAPTGGTSVVNIVKTSADLSSTALDVSSTTSGNLVVFTGNNGNTLFQVTQSGNGVAAQFTSTSGRALDLINNDASGSAIETVFRIARNTSGTPAAGIGLQTDYIIESLSGSATQGFNQVSLTDVTGGAEITSWELHLANGAGSNSETFSVLGTGEVTMNGYGAGSITGTPTQSLAVDTNGQIIETTYLNGNLYTVDGTIADPLRTVTFGSNEMQWDAAGSQITPLTINHNDSNISAGVAIDINVIDRGSGLRVIQDNGNPCITAQNDGLGQAGLFEGTNTSATAGIPITLVSSGTTTNITRTALRIDRTTTGTAAAGIGGRIMWYIESLGALDDQGSIDVTLRDVTADAEIAVMDFHLADGGAGNPTVVTFDGEGQVTFVGYGSGSTLTTGATATAGFDNSGNLVRVAGAPGDNIYTTDGSIPVDRTVTTGDNVLIIDTNSAVEDTALRINKSGTQGSTAVDINVTGADGDGIDVDITNASNTDNCISLTTTGTNGANGSKCVFTTHLNGGFSGEFRTVGSATSTATSTMIVGTQTTGTAAAGLGTGIEFKLESDTGSYITGGELQIEWTDPTNATPDSDLVVTLRDNGSTLEKLRLLGSTGELQLADYDGTTLTGTPAGGLFTESDGTVVEEPLTSSPYFSKEIHIPIFGSGTAHSTGDGTAGYVVPAGMNGYNIVNVVAASHTSGSGGTTDVQIRRRRAGADVDVLSAVITLANTEQFAQDGTINTANDDVQTGDILYADVDAVQTGSPTGLDVVIELNPA